MRLYEHLFEAPDEGDRESRLDLKTRTAEWFLKTYREAKASDIYQWLHEGEFGYRSQPDSSLDRLTEDIRLARYAPPVYEGIWEPLGLSDRLIKVNVAFYSDAGCPLPRLIQLNERVQEIRPNSLRFKANWNFMKTEIVPGMNVTLDQIHQFENEIPFHMTPAVNYSSEFLASYGRVYRIVPRRLFFQYFPEYRDDFFANRNDNTYFYSLEED